MRPSLLRPLLFVITALSCGDASCQTPKPAASSRAEPGLETAVKWKWSVTSSDEKDWGLPLPEVVPPKQPGAPALTPTAGQTDTYEVKKGDALAIIARKFGMKVQQLKQFNDLAEDRIRIGQVLRIPTPEQLQALIPPPEPEKKVPDKKKKTPEPPKQEVSLETKRELETILVQAFLDREGYSPGPIDGKSNAVFLKIRQLYHSSHEDARDVDLLKGKAQIVLGDPLAHYTLRGEDFRCIRPPKAEKPVLVKKGAVVLKGPPPPPPPLAYDEMITSPFLPYLSAWEFVAERFHCDEILLRKINPLIRSTPTIGTDFIVPNVPPFEIEHAFDAPLQPAADPAKKITATVVELSRLEIYRDGKLIAIMPIAAARPGLRGKGSWAVLDAIARPRLVTRRELKDPPKAPSAKLNDGIPTALPVPDAPLEKDEHLAAGPNNPIGIFWINLAKTGSTDPLPYGLHGTSIPAQMSTLTGLGGFRLTNWDIARVVRLLPAGTVLQWKVK